MANVSSVIATRIGQINQNVTSVLLTYAIAEIIVGVAILIAGLLLWKRSKRSGKRMLPTVAIIIGVIVLLYGILNLFIASAAPSITSGIVGS